MRLKIEVVLLPQSQLIVVVVEALFGETDEFGGLLQADFFIASLL